MRGIKHSKCVGFLAALHRLASITACLHVCISVVVCLCGLRLCVCLCMRVYVPLCVWVSSVYNRCHCTPQVSAPLSDLLLFLQLCIDLLYFLSLGQHFSNFIYIFCSDWKMFSVVFFYFIYFLFLFFFFCLCNNPNGASISQPDGCCRGCIVRWIYFAYRDISALHALYTLIVSMVQGAKPIKGIFAKFIRQRYSFWVIFGHCLIMLMFFQQFYVCHTSIYKHYFPHWS